MNEQGAEILECLREVAAERARRAASPALAARVLALKAYQQSRFEHTYADLLASPRYRAAARFFLTDLYGSADFTRRDDQFARVVPGMTRLFSTEVVATVVSVSRLHALSEQLDTAMALACTKEIPDHAAYAQAWRAVGRRADRLRQIALVLEVGSTLDRLTRRPMLYRTLLLMRGPARLAGLDSLHEFLIAGFETFRAMHGAEEFLRTVGRREHELAETLFAGGCLS